MITSGPGFFFGVWCSLLAVVPALAAASFTRLIFKTHSRKMLHCTK